jgi:REP element-mobilizing transposase RayT
VSDDEDRLNFLNRIGKEAEKTGMVIYAWALMSNHAHLLVRSASAGLVSSLEEPERYLWSDHAAIMGQGEPPAWQNNRGRPESLCRVRS